jgi:hypothetical protein
MRSYLVATLAFAVATASSPLWADVQQKQLSKEIMVQFEEMNLKGDNSKEEYFLKNPHFFWMDSSATAPTILGEMDLKGTLKIIADYKGNNIKAESDGITHVIVHSSDPEDEPVNFFVDGKINNSIDIDFKKIEGPVAQFREGNFSKQTILPFLEAITKASSEAKNLKFTGDGFGTDKSPTIVESSQANYVHTSGATPEEFTWNLKTNQSSAFVGSTAVYNFPNSGKMDSSYDLSAKLPAWAKWVEYANDTKKNGFPEGSFNGKMNAKSNFGNGAWEYSLSSKKSEANSFLIETRLKGAGASSPNWVKEFQGVVREPFANEAGKDESKQGFIEKMIYNWVKSPHTTAFLSLLPLENNLDLSASFEVVPNAPNLSREEANNKGFFNNGKISLSLLGNRKTGILSNFNYKGDEGNSDLALVGGRPLFDHAIALYNAFGDSIASFWRIPKFTAEDKDGLFNLLAKYADQPAKANSELKFSLRFKGDDATLGGKDINEFVAALTKFYHEFGARRPDAGEIKVPDQGFESYGIQPRQGAHSPEMQPSHPH